MATTEELIIQASNIQTDIKNMEVCLSKLKKTLYETECKLYRTCNHEWVADRSDYEEHKTYECRHCRLGKFPAYYQ